MKKLIFLRNCFKEERGSQAIEFTAIVPLFIFMIILIWQFASTAYVAVIVNAAARDGARAAIVEEDSSLRETKAEEAVKKAVGSGYAPNVTVNTSTVGTDYVKVDVTLPAPILKESIFENLSIPISASATMLLEDF